MHRAHVISHTHWDREWYKTFQHFRVRLVHLIDKLMDMIEKDKDYKCFMLDGQTVVLEDYLQIKPKSHERLKRLIQEGKIIIGPWYIQPDEFVPDGESLLRNLLISDRIARDFGKQMKVGYLPDSFGQSGQMPQILKGFGINSAVMMRGVPLHELQASEFVWEAISGDDVVAVYLPLGYSNAMFLPKDFEKADIRMKKTVSELKKWATTDNILIMNGVDHEWPEPHITNYIKHLNETDSETEYVQDTLEDYIDSVVNAKPNLKKLTGELIIPERSRVHTSIVSSRIYQKQANRKAEALLEKYVEPICSISWLKNAKYPGELINQGWKYLIQNQAHDSIGGCCTDEAHREIDQRFTDVENIGQTLLKSYSRAIVRQTGIDRLAIVIFNSSMTKGKQLVNAVIYVDDERFILKDADGNVIPHQIDKVTEINAASLSIWSAGINLKETKKKVEFSFYVDFNSNVGYKTYFIEEEEGEAEIKQETEKGSSRFENDFFTVEINENGSINVTDKQTGRRYNKLHVFEDCGDAGDTYNFSPVKNDTVVTSETSKAEFEIVESGDIKTTIAIKLNMEVPKKLVDNDERRSDERVLLPITTYLTLYSKIKRIDFKTVVENNAFDHRLRVLFPSGVKSDYSFAEIQFGTLKRPNKMDDSKWETGKWAEKPLPIYSQQKFVDFNDGEYGIAVLNRGLTEYEIYDNTTIALTLLRGVGMMGKRELLIRPGRPSGIEVPTPDALCLGIHVFEYALVPHAGNWDEAGIPAAAAEFDAPALAVQNMIKLNNVGDEVKLFEVETLTKHIQSQLQGVKQGDEDIIKLSSRNLIISALKKAEDEEALIIRLYNAGSSTVKNETISINLENISEVVLTNFNEDLEGDKLSIDDEGSFILPVVKPYCALTLKVRFK